MYNQKIWDKRGAYIPSLILRSPATIAHIAYLKCVNYHKLMSRSRQENTAV